MPKSETSQINIEGSRDQKPRGVESAAPMICRVNMVLLSVLLLWSPCWIFLEVVRSIWPPEKSTVFHPWGAMWEKNKNHSSYPLYDLIKTFIPTISWRFWIIKCSYKVLVKCFTYYNMHFDQFIASAKKVQSKIHWWPT